MGLEKSWNNDVGLATLNPQPVFPELYYPLWWYSGSTGLGTSTTSTSQYAGKGTSGLWGSQNSSTNLFTLNSNWPSSMKYAFEASVFSTSSGTTLHAGLYDFTAGTSVSGSQISTSSTTMSVMRSGKFTLIPSHTYGIQLYASVSGSNIWLTDASLIIFPQASLTSPSVSSISLANPSGNTLKEACIPLWVYSSGTASTSCSNGSGAFLQKGSTTVNASGINLYTVGSNWKQNQQFALEVSIYTNAYTVGARLYDITNSSFVIGSQVSTTATTSTLIRSGTFTLIPSHSYGLEIYDASNTPTSHTAYISKAHLVALAP